MENILIESKVMGSLIGPENSCYINELDPNFNKLCPNHMCFPALGATSSSYWLLDMITSALIGCQFLNYGLRLQIFAHFCDFVQFITVRVSFPGTGLLGNS